MKTLKKIIIWFVLCIVAVVAIKVRGYEVDPHNNTGVVLGEKAKNPGFGPLLEKTDTANDF